MGADHPGILRWAVEGCLAWQREGLRMPEGVRQATVDYLAEQDLIAQWLAERCRVKPGAEAGSLDLYTDWRAWTEARGEDAGTCKALSAALEQRHGKKRTNRGVVFEGIQLHQSAAGVP